MSESKRLAGEKAIEFVEDGSIVGVGLLFFMGMFGLTAGMAF